MIVHDSRNAMRSERRSSQGLLLRRTISACREVRAVDDVTLVVRRNEIYGIAGESSCGKTSLIKTLAGAIRPPLRVIDGSVRFDFGGETSTSIASRSGCGRLRWRHLSTSCRAR